MKGIGKLKGICKIQGDVETLLVIETDMSIALRKRDFLKASSS